MKIYDHINGGILELRRTAGERAEVRVKRMRKAVWLAVVTMSEIADREGGSLVMYTLTYRKVGEWQPRHIVNMVRWLRRQKVTRYVWVAELQRRGAVHYHILALLPAGQRWRKPTAQGGGWAHGFTWVTSNVRYPWYIMKYLQKGVKNDEYKRWPPGIRLYAISQTVIRELSFQNRADYNAMHLPAWFRQGTDDCTVRASSFRCVGGVAHGRFLAISPYSKTDLPASCIVAEVMYTKARESGLLSQP